MPSEKQTPDFLWSFSARIYFASIRDLLTLFCTTVARITSVIFDYNNAVPFAPVFQARLYGSLLFNAYTTPILHLYKI